MFYCDKLCFKLFGKTKELETSRLWGKALLIDDNGKLFRKLLNSLGQG